MKKISILDTSICGTNLGDQIIMDAVNQILNQIFNGDFFIRLQTHDVINKVSYEHIQQSEYVIVGGTNLLSSNMNYYNQWKISLWDSLFIKDVILMGVGWCEYQPKPNLYTKILYNKVLNKSFFHSVRDSYSEKQLKSIGIDNVINTSCPTMWSLTEEHCSNIPCKKSSCVLLTFTKYRQCPEYDFQLINLLKDEYKKILFWIQQPEDFKYMRDMCGDDEQIVYIQPTLKALDKVLLECDLDYIGTRLHAGIRALQAKKRTLIISVDNRATEIAKDTNLPTISRDNIEGIANWINSNQKTFIKIPIGNIREWKNQFI